MRAARTKADRTRRPNSKIKVAIGFDKNLWGSTEEAEGETLTRGNWRMGVVDIKINSDSASDFLENVAASDNMWISFPDGNEVQWNAKMVGSRNSVNAFKECLARMDKTLTQRYGNGGTQPFSNPNASQPFSSKPVDDVKSSRNKI